MQHPVDHGARLFRFGRDNHATAKLRRKPRLFPSSLQSNSQRAEGLFTRQRQAVALARETRSNLPLRLRTPRETDSDDSDSPRRPSSRAEDNKVKVQRRTTRSAGQNLDDWIKLPMTARVAVAGGSVEMLDGHIYVSVHTLCCFKHQGKVIFETHLGGVGCKFLIPEGDLPMISEEHPLFREESSRLEEERAKKLDKARHMFGLVQSNEEAALEIEEKCSSTTLAVRRTELKQRLLTRLQEKVQALQEELQLLQEEDVAIRSLELMQKEISTRPPSLQPVATADATQQSPASTFQQNDTIFLDQKHLSDNRLQPPSAAPPSLSPASLPCSPVKDSEPEPIEDPLVLVLDHDPVMDFDALPTDLEQGLPSEPPADGATGFLPNEGPACGHVPDKREKTLAHSQHRPDDSHGKAVVQSTSRSLRQHEQQPQSQESSQQTVPQPVLLPEADLGQGKQTPSESRIDDSSKTGAFGNLASKRRKISAVDLVLRTFVIASDVSAGLRDVGTIDLEDSQDIDEIDQDMLYPDPEYGDDIDLLV